MTERVHDAYRWRWAIGLAVAYFAAAKFGLLFAFAEKNVSLVWPPTGLALAALLLLGPRLWPGVFLGALLANATTEGTSLPVALGIATGNTLEAVAGAALLRRLDFHPELKRLGDVFLLAVPAALGSTLISASLGIGSLLAGDAIPSAIASRAWLAWWVGDAMGALLFTPFLLTLPTWRNLFRAPARGMEFLLLTGGLSLTAMLVFGPWAPVQLPLYPLSVLLFPFVTWAALRFGVPGATLASLLTTGFAVWGAANQLGPFASGQPLHVNLASAWAFLGVFAVTALILAVTASARRRAEGEAREAEARYRSLVEQSLVGIYVIEGERFTYVNPRLGNLLGYSPAEITSRPSLYDFVVEEDIPRVKENIARRLRGETLAVQYNLTMKHRDGHPVDTEVFGTVATRDGKRIIMGVMVDVTERHRAEQALSKSERMMRNLFDTASEGIWLMDREQRTILANRALLAMLGLSEDAILFRPVLDFIAPAQREACAAHLEASRETGSGQHLELTLQRPDGQEVFAYFSSAPLYDEHGAIIGTFSMVTDISARKKAEADLQRLNEALESRVAEEVAKNREKDHLMFQQARLAAMGEMIGNIAHQWRQPLNALGLLLANIKDAQDFGELDAATVDKAVHDGNRLIRKMSSTIDDFRNFFRPNKQRERFSVVAAVDDALELLAAGFKSHSITVAFQAREDVEVEGYPNEFSQVVLNLVNNAKEALTERQVEAGRIFIEVARVGDQARVTVRDNAGGIPEDILGRVFEPYFTTKEKGTGIGLYMSKMIVENNMGGGLHVHNTGDGAEFVITLPLAEEKTA